ncbi:MAG: hypothetical protein IKE73_03380 [Bacilli bacterium]|nr:hypothetical protein [Bacilli bacterium]
MDKLKYEIINLRNGKQYFVLETVFYEYDIYNLCLNVEDEFDIKVFLQEVKGGKTVLTEVNDKEILKNVSSIFEQNLRNKINSTN